jgi:hypothetical protein
MTKIQTKQVVKANAKVSLPTLASALRGRKIPAGYTFRGILDWEGVEELAELCGFDLKDLKDIRFSGNRTENKGNRDNLERAIPDLESFDCELGELCIGGWGSNEVSIVNGGHRLRRLIRLLDENREGQVEVRILFSSRPAHMGGYDTVAKLQSASDQFTVRHPSLPEFAKWSQQCGNLIRLRSSNSAPKGASKAACTWKGVVLSPEAQAAQWDDKADFSGLWNLWSESVGDGDKSAWDVANALEFTYKIPSHYLLVALVDIGWNSGSESSWSDIVNRLNTNAETLGKHFGVFTNSKKDINDKYYGLAEWLYRVCECDKSPEPFKQLSACRFNGLVNWFSE